MTRRAPHRAFISCPLCAWKIGWTYLPNTADLSFTDNAAFSGDPDPGLIAAEHVETYHPETIYGDLVPVRVVQKLLARVSHSGGS